MGCAQSVTKNSDTKFIDFVNSFKEETKSDIIDLRRTIGNEAPVSKEEALEFVYHTADTTKLYCVDFDYSNENEEFRGIIGASLYLPDKCLKIDMEDYFFIAYNSYQCINNIDNCPDPNDLRDCFLNEKFKCFLTLCVVDKGFNLRDSMLVCMEDELSNFDIAGLLNPNNSEIFLFYTSMSREKPDMYKACMYEVNKKNLKFEIVKKGYVGKDIYTDDLMKVLEKLGWKESFLE
jgi:hypothetical protein